MRAMYVCMCCKCKQACMQASMHAAIEQCKPARILHCAHRRHRNLPTEARRSRASTGTRTPSLPLRDDLTPGANPALGFDALAVADDVRDRDATDALEPCHPSSMPLPSPRSERSDDIAAAAAADALRGVVRDALGLWRRCSCDGWLPLLLRPGPGQGAPRLGW